MSLMDLLLQRRAQYARRAIASQYSRSYVPWGETLEDRQCPSVAAPTGVHLTAVSSTQVQVTWNDVAGESGFFIEQWTGKATIQVGKVGQHVTTFTVGQLQPNQMQWFSVQAFDGKTTAQSTWASVLTPPTPITAPTNLKASNITLTQASLTWGAATGQTGYHIYSWNGTAAVLVGSVAANVTSFKVLNLTPGTTNYFYVQAFNATNSATSGWLTVSTQALSLTAPTNLQASALDSSSIALSWNDSSGEAGFRVYGWNGIAGSPAVLLTTLAANTTGFQVTELLPGQTYWFYVQAFNDTSSANSVWVSTTTISAAPLKGPTQFAAIVTGPNTVTLSWIEPSRAVGYNVYVWGGSSWLLAGTVAAGTHQVPITGLASNQTQWFMVQARPVIGT